MSKIIQVINAMITNERKIGKVVKKEKEFYFLYDNKYKWSINNTDDGDYILYFYAGAETIEELSKNPDWNFVQYVTYSSKDFNSQEALESFKELYQVVGTKLYGLDQIFDDILGASDF